MKAQQNIEKYELLDSTTLKFIHLRGNMTESYKIVSGKYLMLCQFWSLAQTGLPNGTAILWQQTQLIITWFDLKAVLTGIRRCLLRINLKLLRRGHRGKNSEF